MVWPSIRIQVPSWNGWQVLPIDAKECKWRDVAAMITKRTGIAMDRQLWIHEGKLVSAYVPDESIFSYISEYSNNVLVVEADKSHLQVQVKGLGSVFVAARAPTHDLLDQLAPMLNRVQIVSS